MVTKSVCECEYVNDMEVPGKLTTNRPRTNIDLIYLPFRAVLHDSITQDVESYLNLIPRQVRHHTRHLKQPSEHRHFLSSKVCLLRIRLTLKRRRHPKNTNDTSLGSVDSLQPGHQITPVPRTTRRQAVDLDVVAVLFVQSAHLLLDENRHCWREGLQFHVHFVRGVEDSDSFLANFFAGE
jgi:hypothetical protein